MRWSEQDVAITISDDGPGFPPEILAPHRRALRDQPAPQREPDSEESGLGLGFFIAKTLLERSGASACVPQPAGRPTQGAVVRVRWARGDFETTAESLLGGGVAP